MWRNIVYTCSTIARVVSGIFATISLWRHVLIAALIFIAETYRSTAHVFAARMAGRHPSADGTGEDGRS